MPNGDVFYFVINFTSWMSQIFKNKTTSLKWDGPPNIVQKDSISHLSQLMHKLHARMRSRVWTPRRAHAFSTGSWAPVWQREILAVVPKKKMNMCANKWDRGRQKSHQRNQSAHENLPGPKHLDRKLQSCPDGHAHPAHRFKGILVKSMLTSVSPKPSHQLMFPIRHHHHPLPNPPPPGALLPSVLPVTIRLGQKRRSPFL